jgi:hypothetical protein
MHMHTHQAVPDLAAGAECRAADGLGLPPRERPRRVHPHRLAVERGRRPGRLRYVTPAITIISESFILHMLTSCYLVLLNQDNFH